jgi:C-terminal processing protease CtpA/Prc
MNLITTLRNPFLCRSLFSLVLVLTIMSVSPAQDIGSYEKERGQIILGQVASDIRSHYYDSKFHGVDLDVTFKAAADKIKSAQSNGQIMGIIAQACLSLGDSHTFFVPPQRQVNTDYGWQMQLIGDDVYVARVKDKADAQAKGLKVGDMVHLVDGFQPVRANLWKLQYLYYALRPQAGMHLAVSSPGEQPRELDILAKVTDRKRVDLTNYVEFMNLVVESENEERERKRSHRTKELDGLFIWNMPAFNLSASEVDAMMDKVRLHKSLILDLRGNSGGYEETLLRLIGNLFDHDLKVGDITRRKDSKPLLARTRGEKAFKGRVIVLVDSASASSAEILARVIQLEKSGVVLGDRTAGAVMRARVYEHEVGVTSAAFFAMSVTDADLKMSDGQSLEGTGVTPDEIRLPTGADLVAKRDPVLAYAAKLAGVTIEPDKAAALFPELKSKP